MKTRALDVNHGEQTHRKHPHLNYSDIAFFSSIPLSWIAKIRHISGQFNWVYS